MRVLHGLDGLRQLPPATALSIGNFDGVHRGHASILQALCELRDAGSPSETGNVAVVTFEPHPLTVLRPEIAPPRLAPLSAKRRLLDAAGVGWLVELPPDPSILNLSAEDFWMILRDEVRPRHLVEGATFNFGKNRTGTIDRLRDWASVSAITLHVVPPVFATLVDSQVVPVSSSLVRFLIACGRLRDAGLALGRAYAITGPVVKGFQRGRTIGVPTANLEIHNQLIPADGVYAGRCEIDGQVYATALSIGTSPTFSENKRQIEAHLIGYSGDLYDKVITVEVDDWIRDQRKFDGVESLKAQIARDIQRLTRRAIRDERAASLIP